MNLIGRPSCQSADEEGVPCDIWATFTLYTHHTGYWLEYYDLMAETLRLSDEHPGNNKYQSLSVLLIITSHSIILNLLVKLEIVIIATWDGNS